MVILPTASNQVILAAAWDRSKVCEHRPWIDPSQQHRPWIDPSQRYIYLYFKSSKDWLCRQSNKFACPSGNAFSKFIVPDLHCHYLLFRICSLVTERRRPQPQPRPRHCPRVVRCLGVSGAKWSDLQEVPVSGWRGHGLEAGDPVHGAAEDRGARPGRQGRRPGQHYQHARVRAQGGTRGHRPHGHQQRKLRTQPLQITYFYSYSTERAIRYIYFIILWFDF